GGVSAAERAALAARVAKLDPASRALLGRIEGAVNTVSAVNAALPPSQRAANAKRLLASDPWLVSQYSGGVKGGYVYDPHKAPTAAQETLALNNVLNQQNHYSDAQARLNALAPYRQQLMRQVDQYGQAVQKYNAGRGGDPTQLARQQKAL